MEKNNRFLLSCLPQAGAGMTKKEVIWYEKVDFDFCGFSSKFIFPDVAFSRSAWTWVDEG